MPQRPSQPGFRDGFIFWHQPLRVTGSESPAGVISKLRAQFSGGRFGVNERLSGTIDGERVRAFRKGAFAAADVVQFEGTIRTHAAGVVIDGRLNYTPATRLQFAGSLALGLALLGGGALDGTGATGSPADLLGAGAAVTILSTIWIFASRHMRHEQVAFIKSRLEEAAEGGRPPPDRA